MARASGTTTSTGGASSSSSPSTTSRRRDAFRDSALLRAALDHAPDRVLVYPHRGGGAGIRQPRRPRPLLRSGGAELPAPDPDADRMVRCSPVAARRSRASTVNW